MSAALQPMILIMAGGTGGHVFPALTIADELRKRGSRVEWLGTSAGIEARVVVKAGIPLHFISVAGVRGKSVLRKLLAPLMLGVAVLQALRLMLRLKPACVLGMGGYVSGPGGVAAKLLGKPLLIHEQNAVAGMANRLLLPLARQALEGFPGAFRQQSAKVRFVGNPVRADLLAMAGPTERLAGRNGPVRVLVVGGSLGAAIFNQLVPQALAGIEASLRPVVRHQCGRGKLDSTLQAYKEAGLALDQRVDVSEFIDDMAAAYAWADLVVCRAGASTLAELAVVGLPAILVPYPFAADDHQSANARQLANTGGAVVLPQQELTAETLRTALLAASADRSRLLQQALQIRNGGRRDAGTTVAGLCLEVSHG